MLITTKKITNGNALVNYMIYKCDNCDEKIEESWPKYQDGDCHLCLECGFKLGHITEEKYLKSIPISLENVHAAIDTNGDISLWQGKSTPPWERGNSQIRSSPKYHHWRTSVFERDNYTCQECNQRGGELNAHHIKSFAKHKKLRFDVNNGIALCVNCHRNRHKEMAKK